MQFILAYSYYHKEGPTIVFIGAARYQEDKVEDVVRAVQAFMPTVREEEGTLEYVVYRGIEDPTQIFFYEVYRDEEAWRAHRGEPLQDLLSVLRPALQGESVGGTVGEITRK